jgi:hypothetical protein
MFTVEKSKQKSHIIPDSAFVPIIKNNPNLRTLILSNLTVPLPNESLFDIIIENCHYLVDCRIKTNQIYPAKLIGNFIDSCPTTMIFDFHMTEERSYLKISQNIISPYKNPHCRRRFDLSADDENDIILIDEYIQSIFTYITQFDSIHFSFYKCISNEVLELISKNCLNFKSLFIEKGENYFDVEEWFSYKTFEQIIENCQQLQNLNISFWEELSEDTMIDLFCIPNNITTLTLWKDSDEFLTTETVIKILKLNPQLTSFATQQGQVDIEEVNEYLKSVDSKCVYIINEKEDWD